MNSSVLTNDDKIWLYRNGYYCMQDPLASSPSSVWRIQEWIKWIDEHGSWGHTALKMRERKDTQ